MNVEPLYDRVLLKLKNEEETSDSGIILIAGETNDDIFKGEVLAVGSGRMTDEGALVPLRVEKGDTVLFDLEDSAAFTLQGSEYFLLPEAAIYAILK